jgi:hypothetical protein
VGVRAGGVGDGDTGGGVREGFLGMVVGGGILEELEESSDRTVTMPGSPLLQSEYLFGV